MGPKFVIIILIIVVLLCITLLAYPHRDKIISFFNGLRNKENVPAIKDDTESFDDSQLPKLSSEQSFVKNEIPGGTSPMTEILITQLTLDGRTVKEIGDPIQVGGIYHCSSGQGELVVIERPHDGHKSIYLTKEDINGTEKTMRHIILYGCPEVNTVGVNEFLLYKKTDGYYIADSNRINRTYLYEAEKKEYVNITGQKDIKLNQDKPTIIVIGGQFLKFQVIDMYSADPISEYLKRTANNSNASPDAKPNGTKPFEPAGSGKANPASANGKEADSNKDRYAFLKDIFKDI